MAFHFAPDTGAKPVHVIPAERLAAWLADQPPARQAWIAAMGFEASLGETLVLPGPDGAPEAALFGWGKPAARARDRFALALAATRLPAGLWRIDAEGAEMDASIEALGWLLAGYRFERYRRAQPRRRRSSWPRPGSTPHASNASPPPSRWRRT